MKRPPALLILFSLQALAAFLWTTCTPSEGGRAAFLWLSVQRLALAAIALAVFLVLGALAVHAWRSEAALVRPLTTLDRWCVEEHRLGSILIPLLATPLLLGLAVWKVLGTPLEYSAYRIWAPDTFPLLYAIVSAILPLLCLVLLIGLESAAYLGLRYRGPLTAAASWSWERIFPSVIPQVIVIAVGFHWIILAFQLRTFVSIPAWYWKFEPLAFSVRDAWFAAGFLLLFGLACVGLMLRRQPALGLVLVALLGLFLQGGVGMMGGGFETLHDRYFSTYHKAYVAQAAQSHVSVLDGIRRYEHLFGVRAFTSTKPPGLMAFYIGLDHLINGYPSGYTDEVRYERLSQAVTYGFPVLAVLMVPLLYAFARRFLDDVSQLVPHIAPLLYVLAPSAALFSLFPDQAIYPGLFLLGIWFTIVAINRGSLAWAFVLGALLYLFVFFAFTMLPLYPFAGLYLLLRHWRAQSGARWGKALGIAAAIGAGTLVLYVVFLQLLHYDFLSRFERTMAINHNFDFYLRVGKSPPALPETVGTRLGQIASAAWINNLDFAAGIGFPIYLLFLVQAARRVRRFFKEQVSGRDAVLMSMLLSFVILNALGTAQGEVPRLWLFWLPMVALFAALELDPHLRRRPAVILLLGLAQFITIVLTFHFQDLRM